MWILSRLKNDDKVYLLCDKPKYTVGRQKTCDIIGESTQSSLGRLHATLHPYEDRVEIIDTESKYGTYVNEQISSNVRMNPNTAVTLKDGDTIRFGFVDFTWKLERTNIIVLTSTLSDSEKDNLRKDVSILGGQVIDQWSDTCTHLVVKTLSFTVKVLQSMCHAIPIVKPDYFKTMLSAIRCKGQLPNFEKFQPEIVERSVMNSVSLLPNIDRKRLFVGKTLVFMNSRQMERCRGMIECAMGKCSSLDTKKWQKRSLVNPGMIVVSNTSSSTQSQAATQVVSELSDFLRSKGSRMIPESEISLAIVHCSLNKFCNPNHTIQDIFESKKPALPSTLLASNTPANLSEVGTSIGSSINLPETIQFPNTVASTVPSNSAIIDLMDDDDDLMLVQGADLAMSMESSSQEKSREKRKISTDAEKPLSKKPNLGKDVESTKKSNESIVFSIPQRSTRSTSKNQSISAMKDTKNNPVQISSVPSKKEMTSTTKISSETTRTTRLGSESTTKTSSEMKIDSVPQIEQQGNDTATSSSRSSYLPSQEFSQHQTNNRNSEEISIIQRPESQTLVQSQPGLVTSTQTNKRKRIAHRPAHSFISNNNSDSDDDVFKFNQPSTKKPKPKPTKDRDSDSDDNYPMSSGPVAPAPVQPSQSVQQFTQSSQLAPDSWLSRPTPSQTSTNTTIRSKPSKSKNTLQKSSSWQIGQFCISTPPIKIPTDGWFSKDTIKSSGFINGIVKEDPAEKTLAENSKKWSDSFKCGIQVITKSMNLMSTSGKVFKKQRFITPTEIIKTKKVYEF